MREQGDIIANPRIAALPLNHLLEFFKPRAGCQCLLEHPLRLDRIFAHMGGNQHPRPQEEGDGHQISVRAIRQNINGFLYFERVPDMRAERLGHGGDHGDDFTPRLRADIDHCLRKLHALFQRVHDSARPEFHVQHNGMCAGGKFFGKNTGCNQRNGVHRAGHIAQGVQFLIRRC